MQDEIIPPIRAFFRNKWVRAVLVVNVVVIVAVVIFFVIDSMKTAVLELNVTPLDSQISVNGNTSYSNGKFRMFPGVYEVVVSYPGLDSKAFTVDLSHQDAGAVVTFLSAGGDFYHYRLKDNYEDFTALSKIAMAGNNQTTDHDSSAEDFIADFQRNYYLFTTQLPATYSEYDNDNNMTKYVTVRSDDGCEVTLCLKAVLFDEQDKIIVPNLLQGKGFNVKDFEIKYEIY